MGNKVYVIHNGKRPLSYWFSNANYYGKVSNIIGFSWKSFFSFDTPEQATQKIIDMIKESYEMEGEIKLSFKIHALLKKLEVAEYELNK